MRKVIWLITQITPWFARATWAGLEASFQSLIATLRSWSVTAEVVSDEWTYKAINSGFPSRYDSLLKRILWVAVWAALLIGWILASLLTVWIIGLIL